MGSPAVIYHPAVTHFLRYIATTIGRDKVLRTIQYFSRFYAWYLYRTNNPASAIQPWATAKSQLGLTRKIMRVGKFVEHFRAAAEIFDKKDEGGDQVVKYLQVARQLGYAGYLSWDAVTVLDAAGIRSSVGAKDWQRQAYRFWGLGLLASIGAGGWVGWGLWVRGRGVDEKSPDGKVEGRVIERQRKVVNIQLLSDLCDLTVPATALGWVSLDDGIVGLAGTVSSLLGVYGVWQKTA